MRENGTRLRGPRVELTGAAEPAEAAAVVAAIERFLADNAPAPVPSESVTGWQRAALIEGVTAKAIFGPSAPERSDPWL